MGLIQKFVGWILMLAILAMFPWLLPLAIAYWAWKRGTLKHAIRRLAAWAAERNLRWRVSQVDASVSTGLFPDEAVIRFEAPCDDSPYIIVERAGEKRMLIASRLKEEAGSSEDYGAVVASIMASLGDLSWSVAFSFLLPAGGGLVGLIALDRPAPGIGGNLEFLGREAMGQIVEVEHAVGAVAPSLSVRSLKGKELAPLAFWGGSS